MRVRPLTWLVSGVVLGGCAELLGLEEPLRSSQPDAGPGGTAGTTVGGSAAGLEAGAAGADDSAAGAMPALGGTGGTQGRGGSSTGGETGSAGAMAGAAGMGTEPGPILGGSCDGTHNTCDFNNPNLSLTCDGGTWTILESCDNDQRCHPDGECRQLHWDCRDLRPQCKGRSELVDCEANPFEPPSLWCSFGCRAGACEPASGDELEVHRERAPWISPVAWVSPIPVCFRGYGGHEAIATVVRDESERSWGRLLNIDFSGWTECDDPATSSRIEIEFLHDCVSRLGSAVRGGAMPPDDEPYRIGICSSFRDAAGELKEMTDHEELLRFVARHQLGHALGWQDDSGTMAPALLSSDAARLVITNELLGRQPAYYGHKPSGALVTPSGACISPMGSGLVALPCSDRRSGRFDLAGERVTSLLPEAPGCLGHSGGMSVELEPCGSQSASASFRMLRARWSTPERCIMPVEDAAGSPVMAAPCAPVGDLSQAWHFEILARDTQRLSARLRFASTGACVTIPEDPASSRDVPTLEGCDDSILERQIFYLWRDGRITIGPGAPFDGALCLRWNAPDGVLYLDAWCHSNSYWLSGPLETSGGRALTLLDDLELAATELAPSGLPAENQIFDFSF